MASSGGTRLTSYSQGGPAPELRSSGRVTSECGSGLLFLFPFLEGGRGSSTWWYSGATLSPTFGDGSWWRSRGCVLPPACEYMPGPLNSPAPRVPFSSGLCSLISTQFFVHAGEVYLSQTPGGLKLHSAR